MRQLLILFLLLAAPFYSVAVPREWDGSSDDNWFNLNNWTPAGVPVAGDAVIVSNSATILLTNDTAVLSSFTITNATLTFTNWYTSLSATNVTVQDGGVFDLPVGFTDAGPSNRIHIACSNLTVDAGGEINADAGGYLATYGDGAGGPSPGSASDRTRGGGYGGRGGMGQTVNDTGYTYGDVSAPLACGSGGGSVGKGGTGGGAVWIEAAGTVTINGTVSANGSYRLANYGGGGSGGGVYIDCDTIAGTGLVRVNGGGANAGLGGMGGGGRIAVKYNAAGASWPGLRFQATPGTTGYAPGEQFEGKPGTVWLSDMTILAESMGGNVLTDVVLYFGSGSSWTTNSLTISNASFRIGTTSFVVNVSGNVLIDSGADFGVPNLNCGGSILITNGGVMRIQSDPTNVVGGAYGGSLAVTNNIDVGPSSELWLQSDPTDGGSVLVRVENLTVADTGMISGDAYGYQAITGPGAGDVGERRAGGGHGGKGGHGQNATSKGWPSGQPEPPIGPGSGGCFTYRGGFGGALIRIVAGDTVTVDGTISANGSRFGNGYAGGGAGGGIHITCATFAGSGSGLIRANGNDGSSNTGGGGGGGRIAVEYVSATPWPDVRFQCSPGTSYTGTRFPFLADQGTVFLPDAAVLGPVMTGEQFTDVTLFISNFTAWSVDSLTVSNCSFRFGLTNFSLTVTNDIVIGTNGYLGVVDLECRNNLIVTNGGELEVFANATNGTGRDFGAVVSVTNDIVIGDSSWIYVRSAEKDGGSVKFEADRVLIAENGGMSADARGYEGAAGPGKGDAASRRRGGGYGGRGGAGDQGGTLGLVYGSTNAPAQPGSGGCYVSGTAIMPWGGYGGGLIYIDATGAVVVNGTLTANGGRYGSGAYGGGGSGGGILVLCDTFSGGVNAVVQAKGGQGNSSTAGGGGGGRIAIGIGLSSSERADLLAGNPVANLTTFPAHSEYLGQLSVTGGLGDTVEAPASTGDEGTQLFLSTALALTVQGDPNNYGSPLPDAYGTAADKSGGEMITNTVISPADEIAGQRWQCLGWELTNAAGSVISNEVFSTQAVFQINENLFLTWFWTNEWELAVSAGPNGTVNSNAVSGWYTNGLQVTDINPTSAPGYFFSQWIGDVPAGSETNDPLTVTMDQARTLEASFASLTGEAKYWSGTGTWESAANWLPPGMPGLYDDAILTNGSALFGVSRDITSLSISNGAELVFTNWDAVLTVSEDVWVAGTVALSAPFAESGPSNRIQIVCSNFMLTAGGVVDADGAGFMAQNGSGRGADGSAGRGAGGGHGGAGGMGSTAGAYGGGVYDATNAPIMPGSGGGWATGGAGGGVIRIAANDTITVNGTLSADGATSAGLHGGGSGGAIWLSCSLFRASNGVIRAKGGNAGTLLHGGGGGGGRVALTYGSVGSPADITFDLSPGSGFSESYGETYGEERGAGGGTVFLSDDTWLVSPLTDSRFTDVVLFLSDTSSWAVADLVVSNCSLRLGDVDFAVTVAGDMRIDAGGMLDVPQLNVAGSLSLTNGGVLKVHAKATNGTGVAYGALVEAGAVSLGPGSWIIPYSHPTDGGAPKFVVSSLYVATNAGIRSHGRGFAAQSGPGAGSQGAGSRGGGGGYGGDGGGGSTGGSTGGTTYSPTNAPMLPGSGGGDPHGGQGGGAIWVESSGVVEIDGTLDARGRRGMNLAGGGGGGSIWIDCREFLGSTNGLLTAAGGRGASTHGGGGGGGRIAIWWGVTDAARQTILLDPDNPNVVKNLTITNAHESFLGTATATGGVAGFEAGQPGTVVFLNVPLPAGTLFIFR